MDQYYDLHERQSDIIDDSFAEYDRIEDEKLKLGREIVDLIASGVEPRDKHAYADVLELVAEDVKFTLNGEL